MCKHASTYPSNLINIRKSSQIGAPHGWGQTEGVVPEAKFTFFTTDSRPFDKRRPVYYRFTLPRYRNPPRPREDRRPTRSERLEFDQRERVDLSTERVRPTRAGRCAGALSGRPPPGTWSGSELLVGHVLHPRAFFPFWDYFFWDFAQKENLCFPFDGFMTKLRPIDDEVTTNRGRFYSSYAPPHTCTCAAQRSLPAGAGTSRLQIERVQRLQIERVQLGQRFGRGNFRRGWQQILRFEIAPLGPRGQKRPGQRYGERFRVTPTTLDVWPHAVVENGEWVTIRLGSASTERRDVEAWPLFAGCAHESNSLI